METVIEAEDIDLSLDDKIPERYRGDIKKSYDCLKKYGCKSVYLFGSLVTGKIHDDSDIDIGIKGLPPENFFLGFIHIWNSILTMILILWISISAMNFFLC
jgi:predicted nucleotidyltransferase